nr:alpha-mannosidase isoform X1 [Ipomoea batatas]
MGSFAGLVSTAILVFFVVCSYGSISASGYRKYNTGGGIVEGKLNVHLVPHSHDDVGWLKTVDQYYIGSNNSIQGACVENVLDSVVTSLRRNRNRKFIFAEMCLEGIFSPMVGRAKPRGSPRSKRASSFWPVRIRVCSLFARNGGWCMHDEATCHYIDMIDQTTLGHQLIKSQFNTTPRAGWQIDPFGHSAVQAYLLAAEVGFDSVHFARIDYQDREKRKSKKSLEVIWHGSKTFGSSSQIFANAFPVHYSPPDGFDFEVDVDFVPVQDNPLLFDFNVEERVNDFINAALMQANVTRANHIMWTMGDDFQYQYAESWFKQMDKLIHYVNKAARQLECWTGRKSTGPNTYSLADALGIVQHHDAVTGTAKQHTTNDYAKRLAIGALESETVVNSALSCLINSKSIGQCNGSPSSFNQVVVAYNSLGWNRSDVIRIPVNDANLIVQDSMGNVVEAQYIELDNITSKLREFYVKAYLGKSPKHAPKYWLLFQVSVPPLGWNSYFVSKASQKGNHSSGYISVMSLPQNGTVEIGSGNLKLSFSSESGQLKRFFNSRTGVDIAVQQNYLWYVASAGDTNSKVASGAYIFRPDKATPNIVSRSVQVKVIRGPLVDEVHQQFSSWIYQIGPIPTEDKIGKEIVTKMTSNMATNKVFYTDSNGRDFLKRVRNYRSDWPLHVTEPVAGNYYPISLGIYTVDNKSEFSVLVDRATGGASIQDGEIELMLHRRMIHDDSRGVVGTLNETVCVGDTCEGLTIRGNYYVSVNQLGAGSHWRRTTGQEIYSPLLLAFGRENPEEWKASHLSKATMMDPNYSLPLNVALITLQELVDGGVLLRFAHLYEAGEDADYSSLAKVELKKMFPGKTIKSLKEMSLTANQQKSEMKRRSWKAEGDNGREPTPIRGSPVDMSSLIVELGPMEIRTFVLCF